MDRRDTGQAPRLCLLGELELSCGSEPLPLSPAAQRVLVLLAVVHGSRAAPRTSVAEQLWPDSTAERAVSNLRATLWRMPRPRGRALVSSTARTVRLAPEVVVDLWESERQMSTPSETDLPLLQQDLLPRWDEQWLSVAREGYRQRRLHLLESSARSLCEQGRYAEALTVALLAVEAEPLRETAHLRVVEVHLAEGNQSEALRQYAHYRELLGEELGLQPSPALTSVMAPLEDRRARRRTTAARTAS